MAQQLESKFSDESREILSLKQIHRIESVDGSPVTMIAVTRNQFNDRDFPKYENYIKNFLGYPRLYYGLWSDGFKYEHDVLYALPTDEDSVIQEHLNMHNHLNDGIAQVMGLVINSDGIEKVVRNNQY